MATATSEGTPGARSARDGLRRLRSSQHSPLARDASLVAARVGLAWIFVYHGAGTLFGAFGGLGLHRSAEFFASTAHLRPGGLFATVDGVIELFGGVALALGVLCRLAGVLLVGDMVVATITVSFRNGFVSSAAGSGYELNVALAALALVVALLGAGRVSAVAAVRGLRRASPGPP